VIKRKVVSELEFGQAMIAHKDAYPLEVVSAVIGSDENGQYYIPVVRQYSSKQELITGKEGGYENREQLCRCFGRCWDKAEKDYLERLERNTQKRN